MQIVVELAFDPSGMGAGTAKATISLDRLGDQAEKTQNRVKNALKNIAGAFALREIGSGVLTFFRHAIDEAIEAENTFAQLTATVTSTGGAAGYTAQQLVEMAQGFARVSTFEDDVIAAGEGVLLTFTKIGHDVFPRAAQAALDLASKTGGDLNAAMELVGRAMDKPEAASRALRAAHISLTESQEAVIKKLVKTGDVAGAQAVILQQLETRYGGSALAARDTLGGALKVLDNALADVYETAGAQLSPALKDLANDLTGTSAEAQGAQASAENFATGMGQTAAGVVQAGRWILSTYNELRGTFALLWGSIISGAAFALDALLGLAQKGYEALGKLPGVLGEKFRAAAQGISAERAGWVADLRMLGEGFVEVGVEQFALDEGKATEAIQQTAAAAVGAAPNIRALTDEQQRAADKAAKHAERLRDLIGEYRNEALAAEARFRLVGATDAEILKQEIAEARLAAALKLGRDATAAQVAEAQRYAERAVVATHATENWTEALRDLDAAGAARLQAEFQRNVEMFEGLAKGRSVDTSVVDSILAKVKENARLRAIEIGAYIREPIDQAWQATTASALDAFSAWVTGADVSIKTIIRQWLAMWVRAMVEWLVRWLTTMAQARAAQAGLGAVSGGGGGGGGVGSYTQYAGGAAQLVGGYFGGAAGATSYLGGFGAGMSGTVGPVASGSGYAGMLSGSGTAGAAVMFVAYAAIVVAVVAVIANWIKTHRSTKAQIDIAIKDGQYAVGEMRGAKTRLGMLERGVAQPLVDGLNDYLKSVGAIVDTMDGTLTLQRRGRNRSNKFTVSYVSDMGKHMVRQFGRDAQAAMEFAFYQALSVTSFSTAGIYGGEKFDPFMQAAINRAAKLAADSFYNGITEAERKAVQEEFGRLTKEAEAVQLMGLPQGGQAFKEVSKGVDQLIEDMFRLFGATKEFDLAVQNIVANMSRELSAQRDAITGRQKTAAEEYQDRVRQAQAWNAERALREAQLVFQRTELDFRAKSLEVQMGLIRTEAAGAGMLAEVTGRLGGVMVGFGAVSQETLDSMYAQIAALDAIIANLPKPIDIDKEVLRRPRGGGGGVDTSVDSVRRALDDAILSKLPELQQRLAQANRAWDEHAVSVGKNAALLREIAVARGEEIASILAEAQASADARRDEMVLNGNLVAQIRSNRQAAADVTAEFKALWQAGKITRAAFREVRLEMLEIARQRNLGLARSAELGLIGELYDLLGEEEKSAQLRFDLTLAELEIKREELRLAYLELGLTGEALKLIDDLIGRVRTAGPAIFTQGRDVGRREGFNYAAAVAEDKARFAGTAGAGDAVADAIKQLEEYEKLAVDPFRRDLAAIEEVFRGLRATLGDTERVQHAYGLAVRDVMDRYLRPVRELYDSMNLSEFSPLDAWERMAEARAKAYAARDAFRGGDLSVIENVPDLVQSALREMQAALPTGTQQSRDFFREMNAFLLEVSRFEVPGAASAGYETGETPATTAAQAAAPVVDAVAAGAADTTAEIRGLRRTVEGLAADVRSIRYEVERGLMREAS